MKIRCLGSYQEWNPELVVFVCNHLPYWLTDGDDVAAMEHRIHVREQRFYGQYDTNYQVLMRLLTPEMAPANVASTGRSPLEPPARRGAGAEPRQRQTQSSDFVADTINIEV